MTHTDSVERFVDRQDRLAAEISPKIQASQEKALAQHATFQKGYFRRQELNPITPDSLFHHSRRTAILTDFLSDMIPAEVRYKKDKAFALALVHADNKYGVVKQMNEEYGGKCWVGREGGIFYPTLVGGTNGSSIPGCCFDPLYGNIIRYASSFDDLCHALHEVRLGNNNFIPVIVEYKTKLETDLSRPCFFGDIAKKKAIHPLFCLEIPEEIPQISRKEALVTPSGIKSYDFWVKTIEDKLGREYLLKSP